MFRNLTLYRIHSGLPDHATLEEHLQRNAFTECGATQETSAGWVSPRQQEHAALLEAVNGHWFARLRIQSRSVPKSAIQAQLKEQTDKIEAETGRKPGRKEKRDMMEEIKKSLLPQAFVKTLDVNVWFDPEQRLLGVDAVSATRADRVIEELLRTSVAMRMQRVHTTTSPQVAMSHWLMTQEWPENFVADRALELQSNDESRGTVRFARLSIETDEVRNMLQQGRLPVRMSLTWSDKVGFVFSDTLALRSIKLIDTPDEQKTEGHADAFDADATIFSGTFSELLPALIESLGGEQVSEEKQAA